VGAQKMEKEKIIILGIESTAHTFGVGIIENILEKKTKNETENKIQAKNKNSINNSFSKRKRFLHHKNWWNDTKRISRTPL
jgi:hypothetical protein